MKKITIKQVMFISLLVLINLTVQAKTKRTDLTAVYIFRLAENIQWANEALIHSYNLHIIDSSSKVLKQLKKIAKTNTLHGKPIKITHSNNIEIPANTQLIYIAKQYNENYPAIFKQAGGRNILLISDNYKDKRRVMINLLETESQQLQFEINKANVLNQNLGIKPDIILLGGTEIDVARLYRQAQVSLRKQEQRVIDLENKRIALEKNINQANSDTASLEIKLSQQLEWLNQLKDKVKIQEKFIQDKEMAVIAAKAHLKQIEAKSSEQQQFIEQQKQSVTKARLRYQSLADKNQEQQKIIARQKNLIEQEQSKYETLTSKVKEREAALKEQTKQIEMRSEILNKLDKKIIMQDVALASQSETITDQRKFLIAFSIVAGLLIILAIAIYRSNRLKQKINAKLLSQKQLLEDAAEKLTDAKNTAEVANKAKSVFLANMSHELRTPLNAVLGFSKLMQDDPDTTESQQENLTVINRSGAHLLQLINDVLDMSKIEAGRISLEPGDFDLSALVQNIINMMQAQARAKEILLILDKTSNFPQFVHGDEGKIRQILINLLSNAIKFTDIGGVTLRLDSDNGHPDIFNLLIEVEDSGCGIASEVIDNIFIPFEQIQSTSSHEGTGLGLAITKQFVELMEGSIQVESVPGKGTLFSVELQVQHAHNVLRIEPVLDNRQIIGLAKGQKDYRILIVEDQKENQLLLQRLLETVGFGVKMAENGVEAIKLFQQWRPHFIWMDRRMPIMDGMTATAKIRALPGGKNVIIVALTASVFREQKNEVLAAGCDDFIRKPYKPDEIFSCMKKYLDLHYQYQEPVTSLSQLEELENNSFDEKEFAGIANELSDELLNAAMAADGEEILQLLTQFPQKVQWKLKQLLNEYRYDKIIKLCNQNKVNIDK